MPAKNRNPTMMEKIDAARKADPAFDKAHRTVQRLMAAWAAIIVLDRAVGLLTRVYAGYESLYALAGGALLLLAAFSGSRGHIQGAMMLMQINLAVFLLQFTATCFLYREDTALWSTILYGASAAVLLSCSLVLFLNRGLEEYRAAIRQFKGKVDRQPRYYRTNSRFIRNKK